MKYITLPNSKQVDAFCLIKSVEIKTDRNGKDYLDMKVTDIDGEMSAKRWGVKDDERDFKSGDFVKIRGTEDSFNGNLQFKVEAIRKVTEADNVNIADFVPVACLPGNVMLSEIEQVVASFEDDDFKRLVTEIIAKYRDKLLYWPAASSLHHAINGGLLMHTLSILRMADSVTKIYTYLNADLLFSGIILHDIMKIEEIGSTELGVPTEYTIRGQLIGHLVLGAMEIDRIGREIGVPEEKLTLLEHMLISHHGVPEFGCAQRPMFTEAMVLSALDDLDAKLYEFRNITSGLKEDGFSNKIEILDRRRIYNHGLEYEGDVELL